MLLKLVRADTRFDFIGRRRLAFLFTAILFLVSAISVVVQGLSFGIDFRGGILIEVRAPGPVDIAEMRARLSGLDLGEVTLQEFGNETDVLIGIQEQQGGESAAQLAAVDTVKGTLGPGMEYRRVEFVGPKVGDELIEAGILAVSLALGAILLYIWFRFEWQFGLGAVIALIHDVLLTIGIFSITQMEFNLATVAAILTIAGYSINDTVVVYDRVRENLRKYKKMAFDELLNLSLNETLSRTVMTSLTTLLALLALFFFGGEVIRGFSFALIWGVLIGTYSSVYIAVPLLIYFGADRTRSSDAARDAGHVTTDAGGKR